MIMTTPPADLYLTLLKRSLTRALYEDNDDILGFSNWSRAPWKRRISTVAGAAAKRVGVEIVRKRPYDEHARQHGLDWPARAETMVGLKRLDNVELSIRQVLADDVPGDLVETGVWRGGCSILMRGVLEALGDQHRKVWACDSFEGLPPPNAADFPDDTGDPHHTYDELAVSVEQVRRNFARYGLLDDRVQFLKGFFKDSLPTAPIDQVAVLRLDGDMYESTIQALEPLYPKLSKGGFCIVDDYHAVPACQRAVDDYRRRNDIEEEIQEIDGSAVFWRRA
jgi:O-methyltransferase